MALQNRVSLGQSLVAGVAAWVALNVFARIAAPLLGVSFGVTAPFFGGFLLPFAGTPVQTWVGRGVFFAAALGWSLLYRWAGSHLSGPGWLRGLVFGAGIWLVSAVALPLFGAIHPNLGSILPLAPDGARASFPGFLGFGFAGGTGVALSMLAHMVFGATLGALTSVQERTA